MRRTSSSFAIAALALGLAACKHKDAGGHSCVDVANRFSKLAESELAQAIPDAEARAKINAEIPPLHESLQAQCEDHTWGEDVRVCMVAASTGDALKSCEAKLTPDQLAALRKGTDPGATKK